MLFLFTHPTQHPAVRRSDAEASPCGREPHGADGDQRPVPRGHCGGRCREGSQAGSSWNQVSRMLAIGLQASAAARARLHAPAGHRTAWSQSSPADACCPRAWQDRSRDPLEPGEDLWLCGGLFIEMHALVRDSLAYEVAERSAESRSACQQQRTRRTRRKRHGCSTTQVRHRVRQ